MSLWGANGADEVLNGPWFSGRYEAKNADPSASARCTDRYCPITPRTAYAPHYHNEDGSTTFSRPTVTSTVPVGIPDEAPRVLAASCTHRRMFAWFLFAWMQALAWMGVALWALTR